MKSRPSIIGFGSCGLCCLPQQPCEPMEKQTKNQIVIPNEMTVSYIGDDDWKGKVSKQEDSIV
jgi:hypothetical protein